MNAKIRRIKEFYWERFLKTLESDFYGTQKPVWRIRNNKADMKEYVQIKNIDSEVCFNVFKNLCTNKTEISDKYILKKKTQCSNP